MKTIFIDVETTGTDDKIHGLIQLSGIIEVNEQEMDRFDYLIQPHRGAVIDDEALKVNKHTREEVLGFDSLLSQYLKFVNLLDAYIDRYNRRDKFHFIGYNCAVFDDPFLRAWFLRAQNKYYGSYFWWPPIDVSNMAAVKYMENRKEFQDFKLMTVAQIAGITIDKDKAHDSMYDVEITREMFRKLTVKNY